MDSAIITKLDSFFSKYPSKEFKKGDIIIQAGKSPTGIFYIESGIVRRYYLSEEGTEITLNLYKPHTFLPMSWAISDVPNTHFYEAMEQISARFAPREQVLEFLHQEPDVVFDLLKRVYIGMEGLWGHIQSLTSGNSYIKLIASLIILAKRFGKEDADSLVVSLKLSETDLANYAGMSRETASRELQKLKKEGAVTFQKGILTIHNMELLQQQILQ